MPMSGNSILLVDRLHELPYHQGHTLNPLNLFLCPYQLALETPLLILDVFFLEVDISTLVSNRSPNPVEIL